MYCWKKQKTLASNTLQKQDRMCIKKVGKADLVNDEHQHLLPCSSNFRFDILVHVIGINSNAQLPVNCISSEQSYAQVQHTDELELENRKGSFLSFLSTAHIRTRAHASTEISKCS